MGNMTPSEYLSLMTVAQFKAFKKALSVLCKAGMYRSDAVVFLMDIQQGKGVK